MASEGNRRFTCFEATPNANPFIWKLVIFTCKWTTICIHAGRTHRLARRGLCRGGVHGTGEGVWTIIRFLPSLGFYPAFFLYNASFCFSWRTVYENLTFKIIHLEQFNMRSLFFCLLIKSGVEERIRTHQSQVEEATSEALLVLMLCAPSNCRRPFSNHCPFSRKKYRHKLRKVYWIWQVATVRSINHNMDALKELSCRM